MSNPKRPTPNKQSGPPGWVLPVAIGAVLAIIALVVAITLVTGSSKSDSNGGSNAKGNVEVADVVTVTGAALAPLPESGADPAIGKPVPVAEGVTSNGDAVSVPGKGPSVVALIAHWCPHCQREVPVIMKLRNGGSWPANVSLSGISTAVAPERGNYPPSAWLTSAGWDAPVLVDDKNATAASAYGLTGFPFLVWSDAQGKVVLRTAGEIPEATLARMLTQLSKGETPTRTAG